MVDSSVETEGVGVPRSTTSQKEGNLKRLRCILEKYINEMEILTRRIAASNSTTSRKCQHQKERLDILKIRCTPYIINLLITKHYEDIELSLKKRLHGLGITV